MRVGIIGLGYRLGWLARIFTAASPDFQIVGYVDPAPAGLPYAQQHGVDVGTAYGSLDELIGRARLDLLMVGSPNHLHLDHITTGLAAGLRIFAEKPVVVSVEETMALARLLGRAGADRVMVGLVLRYAPLYRDLRAAQTRGELGDIASIEASEHIPPFHGAFFMRDWRRYERYAGSFMLEKCCHDLDLYNGVMGCRPRYVSSFGGRRSFTPDNAPEQRGINDTTVYHKKPSGWMGDSRVFDSDGDIIDFQTAMVEYESGAALSFHTNLNVPDDFRRFAVLGAEGMAEGDFVRNFIRVTDAHSGRRLLDKTYGGIEGSAHYGADEAMAEGVLQHLNTGAALPVSVLDALEAGLLALTMDQARRERRIIDMAPIFAAFDAALEGRHAQ
jgi:predicted dehydrogenase